MDLRNNLTRYDRQLVEEINQSYMKIIKQFKCKNWQYFGNEIGQFNELIYRVVQQEVEGVFTSLAEKLKPLTPAILQHWEQSNYTTDVTFKIIIPRVLYSMYCLRNKRGMIHKSEISPNEMDANILLANAKWILSELIRKSTSVNFEQANEVINSINYKELDLLWNINGRFKVLDVKLSTKEKILLLLYQKDNQADDELQYSIEYKNKSDFKKLLKCLHKDNLINYENGKCSISPIGINAAEKIILKRDVE